MSLPVAQAVASEMFEFLNDSCAINEDVHYNLPDEKHITLKLYRNAQPQKHFAFAAGRGLIRLQNSEKAASEDVLRQLISLSTVSNENIYGFIIDNGYLFPLSIDTGEFQSIELESLTNLIGRIKATVFLMSEVGSLQKDYLKLCGLIMYLLFADSVAIHRPDGSEQYRTCSLEYARRMSETSLLPEVDGEIDANTKGYFDIPDTICSSGFHLDAREYDDIVGNAYLSSRYPGAGDIRYHDVMYQYRNALSETETFRQVIDFVFHFMHDVGVVEAVDSEGNISFYDKTILGSIATELQGAAIRVAKIILDEEINVNLKGVSPKYRVESMEPSWEADSLLSAIYFSIFYLRPGIEIYRKCANPNCGLSFLVKTTSSKRKYCSIECSNAMAQRAFRQRKKMGIEKTPSK